MATLTDIPRRMTQSAATYKPFAPLNDRLLLRDVSTQETEYADGIERAQTYAVKSNEGEVLAVGERVPDDVRAGDVVKFGEFGAEVIKVAGEELLLVRYMDLKGVKRLA